MEAVIAAVYLDAGFERPRAVILRLGQRRIDTVRSDARDAKTALQEWAQARGQEPPDYVSDRAYGPDHAPMFTIEAGLQMVRPNRPRRRRNARPNKARSALLARIGTE